MCSPRLLVAILSAYGICGVLLFSPFVVLAWDFESTGHIKYQPSYIHYPSQSIHRSVGSANLHRQELDLRANLEFRNGPFALVAHGEALAVGGTALDSNRSIAAVLAQDPQILLSDRRRLLDFTLDPVNDDSLALATRLDRLNFSYYGEQLVLRAGRQAVSFGNGLAFQVLDLFNPFSPTEIDKDYKTGDDILYAQYLFPSGNDLELVTVPRRDPSSGNVDHSVSSYVAHYHHFIPEVQVDVNLIASHHYREWNWGIGSSLDLVGGVLRTDLLITDADDRGSVVSWLINYDRSWILSGRNVSFFLEYYRNGFGEHRKQYTVPDPALLTRLDRNELFVQGRDLAMIGSRIEATARWNIFLNQFFHVNDGSGFIQLRSEHDLYQDILLTFGMNLPYGQRGTEFGGIEVAPGFFLRPATEVYTRLSIFY